MVIKTKRGLKELLNRYICKGVTDETLDASGSYPAYWISTIKGCIEENLAMDETDYENTPDSLKVLWKGLK